MKVARFIVFLSAMALLFGISGCGDSSDVPGGSGEITNPSDIDLTKDIQDGKISGYNNADPIEDQYLAVINYFRSLKIQCDYALAVTGPSGSDMTWNTFLADSAEEHSQDMMLSVHYDHLGSGTGNDITGQTFTPSRSSTPHERIIYNGYQGLMTAENIAYVGSTPNPPSSDVWIKVMEKWMTSKTGHCSNIMYHNLTEFGMHESRADANATGGYKVYWTQNFGN